MAKYEERYEEVSCLGFYFENDNIFAIFLDTIEKFGKKEINYYHTFKCILGRIAKHNAGVPDRQNDREMESYLPVFDAMNMKVKYKLIWNKEHTKRYVICEIKIYDNATLSKWPNTRY